MTFSKRFFLFLTLTILFHVGLLYYKNILHPDLLINNFEQERFFTYTQSLKGGDYPKDLSFADSRYFPGIPVSIYLISLIFGNIYISGLVLGILILLLLFIFSYRLTKNPLYSFLVTIFPPIVFNQTSKISTESAVAIFLLVIFILFMKKRFLWASIISGLSYLFRPVSIIFYLPIAIILLKGKRYKELFVSLLGVSFFPIILYFSNIKLFGDGFYQFNVYSEICGNSFALLQIAKDYLILMDKGQWRIIISGSMYIIFSVWVLYQILRHKDDFLIKGDVHFVKLISIFLALFVFSVGFVDCPYLPEFRRYFSYYYPFALIVLYKNLKNRKLFYMLSVLTLPIAFI